jgi:hypothetical protein
MRLKLWSLFYARQVVGLLYSEIQPPGYYTCPALKHSFSCVTTKWWKCGDGAWGEERRCLSYSTCTPWGSKWTAVKTCTSIWSTKLAPTQCIFISSSQLFINLLKLNCYYACHLLDHKGLSIFPAQWLHVFRVSPLINSSYFPKQREPVGLSSDKGRFSLKYGLNLYV